MVPFSQLEAAAAVAAATSEPPLYEIERIVAHRVDDATGELKYAIKWVGYGYGEMTWEAACDVPPLPIHEYRLAAAAAASSPAKLPSHELAAAVVANPPPPPPPPPAAVVPPPPPPPTTVVAPSATVVAPSATVVAPPATVVAPPVPAATAVDRVNAVLEERRMADRIVVSQWDALALSRAFSCWANAYVLWTNLRRKRCVWPVVRWTRRRCGRCIESTTSAATVRG